MKREKDDILPNLAFFEEEVNEKKQNKSKKSHFPKKNDCKQPTEEAVNQELPEESAVIEEITNERDAESQQNTAPSINNNTLIANSLPSVAKIRLERLTKIFSSLAIFMTVITLLFQLATFTAYFVWLVVFIVVFLVALCITIFTFGQTSSTPNVAEDFWGQVENTLGSIDNISALTTIIYNSTGTTCIIGFIFTTIALILNFTCNRRKSIPRIVFLFISLACLLFCYTAYLITGGIQW